MMTEFMNRCSAIAPLVNVAPSDVANAATPLPDVPGVPRATVDEIADAVAQTDQTGPSIASLLRTRTTPFVLHALKMGDFFGHQSLIDGAAAVLGSRLEGVSRHAMARVLGVHCEDSDFTVSQQREIRNDLAWVSKIDPFV